MQDIYLDANATTPVLPQAREAAMQAMAEVYGNPSSTHGSGLKARALVEQVRGRARRILGVADGQLCFTSGATEGIQTAVLSALSDLRRRRDAGESMPWQLLYGATEHKAVPEALRHWNALLGLHLPVHAIPVDRQGRHDLGWLRRQAPHAGLVCTMAANNETGVISDLDGIGAALADSPALWLVDGVQALGKLPLRLAERRIDYAPFSGHKLYAPKGIGLLYVREGAPFTPLMIGGGQEGALRAGTENMAGIAALGAVLQALEDGHTFQSPATMAAHQQRLAQALREAFPGLVFNAPAAVCLPTTLNFAVPGLGVRQLLDAFDAAGLRASGGSACSAAKAQPSHVLEAMGLPAWQSAAAVRLSFGAADPGELIDLACERIRACGRVLGAQGMGADGAPLGDRLPGLVTRLVADGACSYLVADVASRRCVAIDPVPGGTERMAQWLRAHGLSLVAVLFTDPRAECLASAAAWRAALPAPAQAADAVDVPGWPDTTQPLQLGPHHITRLPVHGAGAGATAYLLQPLEGPPMAFVGDAAMPGTTAFAGLRPALAPHTLLLPGHDPQDRFAWTLAQADGTPAPGAEGAEGADTPVALCREQLRRLPMPAPLLVDVREPCEHLLGGLPDLGLDAQPAVQSVPLSAFLNALPGWLALAADTPVLFYCRSGNRSGQAARALRRLGHPNAWSLEGGLAVWPVRWPSLSGPGGAPARRQAPRAERPAPGG